MKILEELTSLGLELTEEQKTAITKRFTEEVISEREAEKKLSKMETERDSWKQRAEVSEESLTRFDGINPEEISKEIEKYKTEVEKVKAESLKAIEERDLQDALEKALSEIKFTSNIAREGIMTKLKQSGLKVSDGKVMGLDDYIGKFKTEHPDAFVNDSEGKKAVFTEKMGGTSKSLTKEEIMAIKDTQERQKAMKENFHLFTTKGE